MSGAVFCVLLFSLTWFSVSGLQLFNESAGVSDGNVWSCPPWLQPGNTSAGEPSCVCPVENWKDLVICDDVRQQWFLRMGNCMTYSNSTVFLAACPYLYDNINDSTYITLPQNLSDLNAIFCDTQNRKGLLCGECKEHFGISVLSNSYRCEDCRKTPHGVLRYLALQFIPLTAFFFFILLTQISVTKPPMSTFVLYCQFISIVCNVEADSSGRVLLEGNGGPVWEFQLVFFSLSDIWNLDFGVYVFPPFCVSPAITGLQSLALNYVSAFYPIVLIVVTYTLIELHSCNFRPVVWLWRPLNKCFAGFRRNWNPRASVIDVFATFSLLSYTKLLFTSMFLLQSNAVYNVTAHPPSRLEVATEVDPNVKLFGSGFTVYAVLALLVLVVVVFLPVLLVGNLVSRCCSCRLCSSRHWHVLQTFIEKFNGYYKDGTVEGSRDYRWVSLQPFALRVVVVLLSGQIYLPYSLIYFARGIVFFGLSLFTAIVQPYKKQYMNTVDALLMANLGLLSFVYTALKYLVPFQSTQFVVLRVITVLIGSIPQNVLTIFVAYKLLVLVRKLIVRSRGSVQVEGPVSEANVDLVPDRLLNADFYNHSSSD